MSMSNPSSGHQSGRDNPGRIQVSMNDGDKTSTPPASPPLPGLAQSSSNSSSSPPEPSTPPTNLHASRINRSRTRNRYPNDLGRVPLHRRGTSKTYEALEDLLKEAGYKETRIFTPETERTEGGRGGADGDSSGSKSAGAGEDSRLSVVKDGMDAVVGFFAGLLPSATSSKTSLVSSGSTLPSTSNGNGSTSESATAHPEPLTASPQEYSPPASPSPLSGSGAGMVGKRHPNAPASASASSRQAATFGAGRRSFDMTEPPTPTTATSSRSNLTSSVDSLHRAAAGDPTPRPATRTTRLASAAHSHAGHSQNHPVYHQGQGYHPQAYGYGPQGTGQSSRTDTIPRTPSYLSVDHHSMHRPSSRSSFSRPGSSQGQYRGQSQAQGHGPASGPTGSASGMPHLPPSSSHSQSHSGARSSHQQQSHHHQQHTQSHHTPLTQANLSQHQSFAHHPHHSQLLHPHSQLSIASPRPSRASAYLRHVASIPTIPSEPTSRPNSTPVNFFSSKLSFSSLTRRSGRVLNVSLNDKPADSEDEDGPPSVYYRSGTGEEEDEHERFTRRHSRAMPPSWLETVARAVLFGGGTVGGPTPSSSSRTPATQSRPATADRAASQNYSHAHLHLQHQAHQRVQMLRPTRSSLSQASRASQASRRSGRSQLSDSTSFTLGTATNTGAGSAFLVPPPPSLPLHPPALFARLERGRARGSESEVSKTRVICRSAPGSRSGSVVRGARGPSIGREDKKVINLNLSLNSSRSGRRKKKGRDGEADVVPSLARTKTEGDVLWSSERKRRKPKSRRTRSDQDEHHQGRASINGVLSDSHNGDTASESGTDHSDADASDGEYDYDDEEEDEGELDLARILVPPKRQNSIKSLRKHLVSTRPARPASRGGSSPVPPVPPLPPSLTTTTKDGSQSGTGATAPGGRLTPNMVYRKPFRSTSLQSSEWEDQHHGDDGHEFERWGKDKGSEDDDEHELLRNRVSVVGGGF
ncbi:hypothetical protein CVT26_010643 [Gymnopilus dilepis]|uniref:Uncharacterized protein n=1 Tax=Gymnopilus dilepis TaxID=231916 RepID=A0A409VI72_9AGAR|nr:hypothetical protein CVT26_010643 [Gymnopilus dilepis]